MDTTQSSTATAHAAPMGSLLGRVLGSLKRAGTTTSASFAKLSTGQKLLGGAALALGASLLVGRTRTRRNTGLQAQAATLDELLYFVNDRIEGYTRAAAESQDAQLHGFYRQLVSQSQGFATDLNAYLTQAGGRRETSTTLKGKFYRVWMDAKAALTGRDEKAILGSNIYGEEWALKAYKEALADHTLTGAVRRAVEHQYAQSQQTYQRLQSLDRQH